MRVYFINLFNLFTFARIEIDGRNWDRSWVTGIGIEVGLFELGTKLGYRLGWKLGFRS